MILEQYLLEIQAISLPLPIKNFKSAISDKRAHSGHLKYAVDFVCPVGTSVYSVLPGKVIAVDDKFDKYGDDPKFAKNSNSVSIQHGDNLFSEYIHLGKDKVFVKVGETVKQGQKLAETGLSGYMSMPHLHFHLTKSISKEKWETVPVNFNIKVIREDLKINAPKDINLVIQKNNLNAPIFKRRPHLARDLYGKFCENKPCRLITYSWVHNGDCIGAMVIVEKPEVKQTKGYKVDVMIIFLHIDAEYRGKNLGGMLVKDVIGKYKKIFLTTDKRSSDVAKTMYEKYGFKIIGKETKTLWHWVKGF
jgi:ribosomal protein S18 acetylase RimI-like enzyme/biotin carboxyl carrier protein